MIVVQKKILTVSKQEQSLKIPADASILYIDASSNIGVAEMLYLGVHYLNTGKEEVDRYFWTIKTSQQLDDRTYGPFKFIQTVATMRGLIHVFERLTKN